MHKRQVVLLTGDSEVVAQQIGQTAHVDRVVAMLVAAFGYIPPALGAVLQEGIDVLVILNALRVGGGMKQPVSRTETKKVL